MIPHELRAAAGVLLRAAGYQSDFAAARLDGGGNNRVFRLDSGGRSAVLKVYFRHESDPRDRLGAEFAFARFAWDRAGLRSLPRPLAADAANGLGLYEFIEGRKLAPGEVDDNAVGQALDFLAGLNRTRDAAGHLALGSETCFAVSEHVATVDRRVARLAAIEGDEPEERAARAFVAERLAPAWESVRRRLGPGARGAVADELPEPLRLVSPSDFGFHNAILPADGKLRFIDFEYAGWDDPARLVGDFFHQVEVPVPLAFVEPFLARLGGILGDEAGAAAARSRLLLPLFAVKWCCILLNDFHPVDRERRRFAAASGRERRAAQLDKARRLLARIDALPRHP